MPSCQCLVAHTHVIMFLYKFPKAFLVATCVSSGAVREIVSRTVRFKDVQCKKWNCRHGTTSLYNAMWPVALHMGRTRWTTLTASVNVGKHLRVADPSLTHMTLTHTASHPPTSASSNKPCGPNFLEQFKSRGAGFLHSASGVYHCWGLSLKAGFLPSTAPLLGFLRVTGLFPKMKI